jgi:hypothetical protein
MGCRVFGAGPDAGATPLDKLSQVSPVALIVKAIKTIDHVGAVFAGFAVRTDAGARIGE